MLRAAVRRSTGAAAARSRLIAPRWRSMSVNSVDEGIRAEHFRLSSRNHPLNGKSPAMTTAEYEKREREISDRVGRQQNKIWSPDELEAKLQTFNDVHVPETYSDRIMHTIMYYGLYHPFNLITGYTHIDPSPKSIEWRLIILESFAGVPGFVAAGFRHFRSLRMLRKDYGWCARAWSAGCQCKPDSAAAARGSRSLGASACVLSRPPQDRHAA